MTQEIVVGEIVALADGVRRVTAPNPGMMTGPGTNTYLVGTSEVAVIDPGPLIENHLELIAGINGIRWVLVTHTHSDHSPGAMRLAEMTGAITIGLPPPTGRWQDSSFRPDRVPEDGEILAGPDFELRMIHTPGHASNHVCYLHEDYRWF